MSLIFPEPDNVKRLLLSLLGDCPDLEEAGDAPVLSDVKPLLGAVCLDDDGNEVAILAADLTASVALGGKLMMLPAGQLEEQMSTRVASEVVVDALSEVFNNLTTTLNKESQNQHIRSLPAEALDPSSESSWWASASHRADYVGEFDLGPGRLILLAR